MLTHELLEELRARWLAQRAPILEHLQPGLSDAAIDAITEPLGVTLTAELRTWWSWHDGVPETVSAGRDARYLGAGDFEFLPLGEAARLYVKLCEDASGVAAKAAQLERWNDADAERHWPRAWFPVLHPNRYDVVACDCSGPAASPSPVFRRFLEEPGLPDRPAASSFGQVINWWIAAIDIGANRYDSAERRWHRDWQRLPDPMRSSSLV